MADLTDSEGINGDTISISSMKSDFAGVFDLVDSSANRESLGLVSDFMASNFC